ncbi:diphthamide synthesis protein, partial [Candidatus Micrarchaeota archaeon]|nr:diphthamide synthesis protein [Candidatus Micrarchaeota archaeon]
MRILLQFPEGLKKIAVQEADELRKEGHAVFLSGSPCYGACDLALEEAKILGVKKIIHYGHSQFVKNEPIEVEYREFPVDFELENLEPAVEVFKGKIIGLAVTVQYVHRIDEMRKFFEKKGVRVKYGKGNYCKYAGQVLGCDWGAIKSIENEVDAVLFVGDGVFHPYGLNTEKPFYSI